MQELPKHETVMDSDEQQVAALYAKALLNAAGAGVDEFVDQLEGVVRECLDRFPSLEHALASPRFSQEEKEAMLDRIFRGRVQPLLLNSLKVLCRRGRIGSLRSIQRTVSLLRDEQLGRLRVEITSSHSLTEQQKSQIVQRLSESFGKQAVLVEKVDASLLGGIVLRIGDRVYDGSILGKLQSMRKAVQTGVQTAIRNSLDSLIAS